MVTMNCEVGLLPMTYLGFPILDRRPHRLHLKGLIEKLRRRLSSWKAQQLSLADCLTLVNLVLTALPTYWMSIFKLPSWEIKKIDRIRRDFLWLGLDLCVSCRLVCWKNECRARDNGG